MNLIRAYLPNLAVEKNDTRVKFFFAPCLPARLFTENKILIWRFRFIFFVIIIISFKAFISGGRRRRSVARRSL